MRDLSLLEYVMLTILLVFTLYAIERTVKEWLSTIPQPNIIYIILPFMGVSTIISLLTRTEFFNQIQGTKLHTFIIQNGHLIGLAICCWSAALGKVHW